MSYSFRKAAHVAATFIRLNGSRPIHMGKLTNLIYLADRERIKLYGAPILDEPRYALPEGPVNGLTYRFFHWEGKFIKAYRYWLRFVSKPKNYKVGLARPDISYDELDELSLADEEAIAKVLEAHKDKTPWQMMEWMHNPENIPEWRDPGDDVLPISVRDIVDALKLPEAEAIMEQYEEGLLLSETLDRLAA